MAKGNFIEYVVSDNPNKYPNDGEQSGYYYEMVEDVTPEVTADWYVQAASSETMTLDEVPEEYRAEVEAKLPIPTEPTYTLDEAATILAQEVSA